MSKISKKARDYCGMPDADIEALVGLSDDDGEEYGGIFGGVRKQAMVRRLTVPSENIVGEGLDNNAFIVIGNDRTGAPHTGNGGKGHTQCDAIDIVAGLGGYCPQEVEEIELEDGNKTTVRVETSPNFYLDAARIYISQKTDVDKNFGIGGEFGPKKPDTGAPDEENIGKYGGKSAIAIKADNIRVIGRESLKLVTGTDKFNSQGGEASGKHGIEIISMNEDSKLQPMVLGDNLIRALSNIVKYVEKLQNIVQAQMHYQAKFNKAVMSHDHKSPFYTLETLPSEACMISNIQCDVETMLNTELSFMSSTSNGAGMRANYLSPSGPKYILSPLNKVN
jgi:hypothetical protein